jgi:hypothetical protein
MGAGAQDGDESQKLMSFPWNEGCRAAVQGNSVAGRRPSVGRPGCDVCGQTHSRDCICGATLAADTNLAALTSFVKFVRSPRSTARETPGTKRLFLVSCQIY